ncbi:MAG: DUF4159 domain-containing protein [Ignavibacteriaceae bacterium]|nr:DUF4159 domain-containing protein [Ignavibacteriaceae bacterium]
MKFILLILNLLFIAGAVNPQDNSFRIVRLKYNGGGDWYNDPSADINMMKFLQKNTNIKVKSEYTFVDIGSEEIFSYPFLFLTGHGNIVLSQQEANRLRRYLDNGGFLYIDDDYGLDKAIRREFKKVFPDKDFIEIPFRHPVYNILYDFRNGPPKTHLHDEKPPRGFGIFIGERMAVYYTFESNPSDGWADPAVHDNPPAKREEALRFGANIILYALTN